MGSRKLSDDGKIPDRCSYGGCMGRDLDEFGRCSKHKMNAVERDAYRHAKIEEDFPAESYRMGPRQRFRDRRTEAKNQEGGCTSTHLDKKTNVTWICNNKQKGHKGKHTDNHKHSWR